MSVTLPSWRRIWSGLGTSQANEQLFQRLVACWSEPHRHYHTLQHLRECLEHFEASRHFAGHPAEIELALWFHDAFYDPTRLDNEARSADWAQGSVLLAGLPAEVARRIHTLVMATRHTAIPEEPDQRLIVDVDLAILGADPERFDESDRQIRAEYAHRAEGPYREGRKAILSGFLGRPRLYGTEPFHAALDARARVNLARALARL